MRASLDSKSRVCLRCASVLFKLKVWQGKRVSVLRQAWKPKERAAGLSGASGSSSSPLLSYSQLKPSANAKAA